MKVPFFSRLYNGLLKHPRYRWVVIGASLIYLVSPIDISPDLIPVVGWIDDGVVATLLATGITQVLLDRRQALKDQKTLAQDPNAALPADSENA
ncbi:YkvA family protein [Nodosilinea sp. PGN35]|uniref:YkvA family protein n=1 Tax=Nodosilinea sp. PGN35 TaxID=3020489 RepID=UPI0023B2AC87|nr:YkvA family protein [Nodosilinea sp. TSF1-S3]MDF0367620.1 YkvA family protein [Nodosilinea sp. TSF1-S3]